MKSKTKQLPGVGTDMAADAGATDEPLSAKVLRRMHQDHGLLMKEYDSWMPMLEHVDVKKHLQKTLEGHESGMGDVEGLFTKHHKDLPPIEGALEDEEEKDLDEGEEVPDLSDEMEDDGIEEKELDDEDVYDKEVDDPDALPADSGEEEVPTPDEALEGMDTDVTDDDGDGIDDDDDNPYDGKSLKRVKRKSLKDDEDDEDEKRLRRVRRKAMDGEDLDDDEKSLLRAVKAWHKSTDDDDEKKDKDKKLRAGRKSADDDDNEKKKDKTLRGRRKSTCPECGKEDCSCKKSLRRVRRKALDGDDLTEDEKRLLRRSKDLTEDELGGVEDDLEQVQDDLGDEAGDVESKGLNLEPHEVEQVGEGRKFLKAIAAEHNFNDEHRHESFSHHKSFDKMCKRYGEKAEAIPGDMAFDPNAPDQTVKGTRRRRKDMTEDEAVKVGGEMEQVANDVVDQTADTESKGIHPHVDVLGQAAKFFKALSNEHAFGDGHRNEAALHGSALEDVAPDVPVEENTLDDEDFEVKAEDLPEIEPLDAPHEPGEMGQKSVNRLLATFTKQQKAMAQINDSMRTLNQGTVGPSRNGR